MPVQRALRTAPALLIILWLTVPDLQAQELASWIPSTDRSANPLIAEILAFSSLTDRLGAARALGLRRDPYVSDLIDVLLGKLYGTGRFEVELVLRVLLESVFPRSLVPEALRPRLEVNRSGVELLADRLAEFGAPLARETYRILGVAEDGRLRSALMDEGRRLTEALKRRNGSSDAEQADRLMAFLEAVEQSGDGLFAATVVSLLEITRTREVGVYSREVLATILPAASKASLPEP
jgi:hypothetical protein